MAKVIATSLICLAVLTGCQQQTSPVVATLPPPNFDGPVVAAQKPSPRPVGPAVAAAPQKPKPRPSDVPQEWIPSAPANSWRWIVIHHSATPAGSAALIDRAHRAQGWDEMGYHFVIGNGTASRDGQIEVGTRWPKQKWGAHAKTPDQQYNNFGIGICLVGNFDIDRPSAAQLRSVAKLTAYLMRTYHIPANHVIGHSDTKATDCPGRHMSVADIRRLASQLAQDTGTAAPTQTASAELLRPITTP